MPLEFPDGLLAAAAELGAIDERGVRVWVRQPHVERLDAVLRVEGRQPVSAGVELSAERDWTAGLLLGLPEPAPGAPFEVEVGGRALTGRLAPSPGSAAALVFGAGSCHMPFAVVEGRVRVREADAAIYPAIADDLGRAGADLLLLTGDQIYADGLAGLSVRDDPTGNEDEPPPLDVTLDAYRRLYRGFFNQAGFRALRERLPVLMMWDDHDIYDNWGSTARKSPLDRRLFEAACRVYAEYQQSRNPEGSDGPPFHWTHVWGDIGFLTLDVRGARNYAHGTMLGTAQWRCILDWLHGDAAATVATLVVVSSVPVAHVARWFTRLFDILPHRISGSVRDRWNSTRFLPSRDVLLDALLDWEAAAPHRSVILLSGDVHCASAFTIRCVDGPGIVRQLTSSALTTPRIFKQRFFNRLVVHLPNLLERRVRFERHALSISHNYALIAVQPLPAGGHRVTATIRAWDAQRRMLHDAAVVVWEPE